jgi:uroporphyrinogen decarboxylase
MTPRERLRRALTYESIDRLPTQINYTAAAGRKMAEHFDVAVEALPRFLGNHMVRLDLAFPEHLSDDGRIRYDWWGAGFDTVEEGYFPRVNPLAVEGDLDNFAWPDPDAPRLLNKAARLVAASGQDFYITPNFGFALFERAWSLRGFEQFLMDLALDPGYAAELLDRIAEIQLRLIDRYLELGINGAYFGDDYGAQKSMLISPAMWRQLIKPRLARLFAPFRERGMPVVMHSDGQIQPILPDLVEIGLTALNPVQPEVLDHRWLQANFGRQLAFYGGISTQTVLPTGAPAEVRQTVFNCAHHLAPDKTGLLIAPSHRLMSDVPMANVEALLEAFQDL